MLHLKFLWWSFICLCSIACQERASTSITGKVEDCMRMPLSLFFSKLNKASDISCPLEASLLRLFIILVTLLWILIAFYPFSIVTPKSTHKVRNKPTSAPALPLPGSWCCACLISVCYSTFNVVPYYSLSSNCSHRSNVFCILLLSDVLHLKLVECSISVLGEEEGNFVELDNIFAIWMMAAY